MSNHTTKTELPSKINTQEATQICLKVQDCMDALLSIIEAETRLLKAGKIQEAFRIADNKEMYIKDYQNALTTFQSKLPEIIQHCSDRVEILKQKHDSFKKRLNTNMETLSVAYKIASKLLLDTAEDMTKKNRPNTYTQTGTTTQQHNRALNPIAVDKAL